MPMLTPLKGLAAPVGAVKAGARRVSSAWSAGRRWAGAWRIVWGLRANSVRGQERAVMAGSPSRVGAEEFTRRATLPVCRGKRGFSPVVSRRDEKKKKSQERG